MVGLTGPSPGYYSLGRDPSYSRGFELQSTFLRGASIAINSRSRLRSLDYFVFQNLAALIHFLTSYPLSRPVPPILVIGLGLLGVIREEFRVKSVGYE